MNNKHFSIFLSNLLFSVLILIFNTYSASAQQLNPAKCSIKLEQIAEGQYKLLFDFQIQDGWYVYSQSVPENGPMPTTFVFDKGQPITDNILSEIGEAKEGYDANFDMVVKKYAHQVIFETQPIAAKAGTLISGTYTYMTCSDKSCLPPKDISFNVILTATEQ